MKNIFSIGSLLAVVLIFWGCVREPDNGELVKYMVVQTEYNQNFINQTDTIFKTYSTFVIRQDTMGFVSTINDQQYITEADVPDFVQPVVNEIKNGFVNAGYTRVALESDPDFSVNVIVLQNFDYYQTVNYGYGYGYPGSYYYGYYNYYYPAVSTYTSNYVTLLIQVVDAKNLVNNKYPIIWSAYIGDLNATLDLTGRTLEAVAKAFEQSPYIQKNQ